MKYKAGDRVRIKSFDWYNENKDENGIVLVEDGDYMFCKNDTEWCGRIVTIKEICLNEYYRIKEDFGKYRWTDEMIEGLVEDETIVDYVKESNDRYRIVIDPRFDIEVDEGEYYAVRRKKEYPKTYEECLSVLEIYNGLPDVEIYNAKPFECKLFESLIRLKRCRDAYRKIAGEEMGLGKPWEPDYDSGVDKFGIVYFDNTIMKTCAIARWERHLNKILEFPTAEMRDEFYENFKKLIEQCKELL
jgi:hypothetical protein